MRSHVVIHVIQVLKVSLKRIALAVSFIWSLFAPVYMHMRPFTRLKLQVQQSFRASCRSQERTERVSERGLSLSLSKKVPDNHYQC